ncbi:MAG: hypothetical protein HC846_05460 [Blastocatellia bacterium]|nr:hypothetical protein [Blastocatellia bacterium]
MQNFFLISLFTILFITQTVAQETFKLKDFVPNQIGYEWQFKNNVKDGFITNCY